MMLFRRRQKDNKTTIRLIPKAYNIHYGLKQLIETIHQQNNFTTIIECNDIFFTGKKKWDLNLLKTCFNQMDTNSDSGYYCTTLDHFSLECLKSISSNYSVLEICLDHAYEGASVDRLKFNSLVNDFDLKKKTKILIRADIEHNYIGIVWKGLGNDELRKFLDSINSFFEIKVLG